MLVSIGSDLSDKELFSNWAKIDLDKSQQKNYW